jgi:hypothetical protein
MPHTASNLTALSRQTASPRPITITDLAEQIADFHNLYLDLDEAEGLAKEARKTSEVEEERDTIGDAVHRIERISTIAYARSRALQDVLLQMEPRTISETMALALVVTDKIDDLRSGAIEGTDHELQDLRRAMLAIVRGLFGSGATTPLLDILSTKADLAPFEDVRVLATADVARFLGPRRHAPDDRPHCRAVRGADHPRCGSRAASAPPSLRAACALLGGDRRPTEAADAKGRHLGGPEGWKAQRVAQPGRPLLFWRPSSL